jgi:YesN/AraC family two-component response regulator
LPTCGKLLLQAWSVADKLYLPTDKTSNFVQSTIKIILSEKLQHRFLLRNMLCDSSLKLIRLILANHSIEVVKGRLGDITVAYDPSVISIEAISKILSDEGFHEITDREKQFVEEIKRVVVDLVHHSTFNAMVRNSDFLVSRFDKSYSYLSTLFSRHEHITLEKYIILQRIEKVKELIQHGELSLSEIAYSMGYSSVQYLSTQFKQITGYSVTAYKLLPEKERRGAGSG